ncbi:DUF58 domain-containing protein [Mycetocola sp. BIGb0189]|uniref:DUF58 domain-containing protein n=1 Tax=Mycetocola sp. BIGb0189 TaxID=2940604 RepID=UPI0037C9AACF
MSTGFVRDLEGSPTRDLTASDISFHALRDYRPGDERRHIHWKATARTGTLTVRQFEETRRSHIVVALANSAASYVSETEFELAVSAVGSIALRAMRDGRELSVVTGPSAVPSDEDAPREPRWLNTRSSGSLLDELSELGWNDSPFGLGELSTLAAQSIPGVSLIFLVCGSAPSVRELRSWSMRFPLGVEVAAVICAPGQVPKMKRVQELSVLDIGYLDDLRNALARTANV